MIIKKIVLHHIRSYIDAEITFPLGTILLGGDIGSGKSTILLALDFALFGITKDLSGSALLRTGCDRGSVELEFEIDGKNIVIRRVLERIASRVNQSSGSLTMDGHTRELTPVELRQEIITLFAYPQELLTKKSLIYRYTVYTPQEEMKSILLGEKEARVDVLRKVFGIDKYKIIKQNAEMFVSEVRTKMKELAAYVVAFDQRSQEMHDVERHVADVQSAVNLSRMDLEKKKKEVSVTEEAMKIADQSWRAVLDLRRECEVLTAQFDHLSAERTRLVSRQETLEQETQRLQQQLQEHRQVLATSPFDLPALQHQLEELQCQRDVALKEIQRCDTHLQHSHTLLRDLRSLDVCPVCRRPVDASHLDQVTSTEERKIADIQTARATWMAEQQALDQKLSTLRNDLEHANLAERRKDLVHFHETAVQEKNKELADLHQRSESVQQQLKETQTRLAELHFSLEAVDDLEKQYSLTVDHYRDALSQERVLAVSLARQEQEHAFVHQRLLDLRRELADLTQKRDALVMLRDFKTWLEDFFLPLMDLMEKQILARVHADFDALFQRWFNLLLSAEVMQVRLDEEFTPLIEQNGHELDYTFLSGGEKTAVALAYRLALNQVINGLLSVIKTRDLLILDEPTDGFSSEQLDQLRLLLDQLEAKQIILVSHELKIEGFVDTVIRLEKNEHATRVLR